MPAWQEDYLRALRERSEREEASLPSLNEEYIEAYTSLLDQVSHLNAILALRSSTPTTPNPSSSPATTKSTSSSAASPAPASAKNTAQLQVDIADVLRSNTQLQTRIKSAERELIVLRKKTKEDRKIAEGLRKQVTALDRKVRDRDEELREKGRGFSGVQDEMISLNLQLNMAEQKTKKLAAENQELIDRWMARKGREADRMNEELR